ncbi:cytochrome P450 [Nocardia nova]|uniref:Cytochrome P450 n=1 Tax=Nocardia nova TaxID=37330 RepID=A0A2S6AA81_9NOCA|nr:cytochrome P450 [Nocardia nova]PPI97074.1 cytochrome P450 [Nocardia nova]PPJ07906.1 cytochrome P450 [Nocardia nova]PPJ30427.1 cytochrome P450 [Nocardia nova]
MEPEAGDAREDSIVTVHADDHRQPRYDFDRHAPQYRDNFDAITTEMHRQCPLAWSPTYGGHWVAAGSREVFSLARSEHVSSDHDPNGERRGYRGITIPFPETGNVIRNGILEMDPPEQRLWRQALNPYLSPAAVQRWVPFVDEVVRASLDDRIESGRIDFVDDLANIVPAVLTLAMLGIPLRKWQLYCEPAHASVYTPPNSPDIERVRRQHEAMGLDLLINLTQVRENPRPGIIEALTRLEIDGAAPPDIEILGMLGLLIGGGFDTTTALTAHALEWLSEHPDQRAILSAERDLLLNSATEEFLRYFTPAPGDGRTIAADCEYAGIRLEEGERLWLSWAMANRDPELFPDPNTVDLDRKGNRHFSFGLGVHRCIGSNVARTVFKRMLVAVLDRLPDFRCDPGGAVHYDTIGVIQGMRHLPATFTPGPRLGPGLDETLETLQQVCDEKRLAEPVTVRHGSADL